MPTMLHLEQTEMCDWFASNRELTMEIMRLITIKWWFVVVFKPPTDCTHSWMLLRLREIPTTLFTNVFSLCLSDPSCRSVGCFYCEVVGRCRSNCSGFECIKIICIFFHLAGSTSIYFYILAELPFLIMLSLFSAWANVWSQYHMIY